MRDGVRSRTTLFLMLAGMALFVAERSGLVNTDSARMAVADAVIPIVDLMSEPVAAVKGMQASVSDHFNLVEDNRRLRLENERLLIWQALALKLERQNAALKSLTNLPIERRATRISARVVADPGGPFVRTVLINTGWRDGVEAGMAVADGRGLIGRIVGVGNTTARVLLITDLDSRIPVVTDQSGARAIMSGTNSGHPVFAFRNVGAAPAAGETVMTSGEGGVFPPSMPIGTLQMVDGFIRVEPFALTSALDHVQIIRTPGGRQVKADIGAETAPGGS